MVGGPGFEPGASRSRTVAIACPLVSWGILQGPAEFNRRSRRLLSCPLRSAWFRDSVPRLCPGAGHFPTIQPVTEVQRLTWEQYLAGEPCRGCGRPMRDATVWSGSGKGLIHLSEEERAQYDSEEQQFEGRHADCHTHRWTMGGTLTTHCGKCCPPPPMSPEQTARIATLLHYALRDQQELKGRK